MTSSRPPGGRPNGTQIVQAGRHGKLAGRFANPPVVHASTVFFDSVEEMLSGTAPYTYGRRGTPTLEALESAVAELEGAYGTVLCPSGLSAISLAMLASLNSGDHCLLPDCLYAPARHFADTVVERLGIEVSYYDPTVGAGIEALILPNTRVVYVETPGSLTFEVQDLPAIAEAAHRAGAIVIADTTWATPFFQQALALGADISVQAATKYLAGHSDVMLGTVSANEAAWSWVKQTHGAMGLCAGPDDVYLTVRGIRTLEVRLRRHEESALAIAGWLETRPEIARVLHPALPSHPGYALWRRDTGGSSGLFSFIGKGWSTGEAAAFLNGLKLFSLGYSWGGFESLAQLAQPERSRTAVKWEAEGPVIRLHIGLEDPADLKADLEAGLDRLTVAKARG